MDTTLIYITDSEMIYLFIYSGEKITTLSLGIDKCFLLKNNIVILAVIGTIFSNLNQAGPV